MPGPRRDEPPRVVPRITRDAAVAELGKRWVPGDHLTLIGPTGRGKSTLLRGLLPHAQHDRIVILCPKGADPVFSDIGHPTRMWPPRRSWRDIAADLFAGVEDRHEQRPIVWRVELDIRGLGDLARAADVFSRVLSAGMARPQNPPDSLAIILDDSRIISDPQHMRLGPLVVGNMLIARSKRVSIVNNYQAPRWVPKEGIDQATQIVMWQNRDRDVVKRLGEIGNLDLDLIRDTMSSLDYHEALWIDGRTDELHIIGQ